VATGVKRYKPLTANLFLHAGRCISVTAESQPLPSKKNARPFGEEQAHTVNVVAVLRSAQPQYRLSDLHFPVKPNGAVGVERRRHTAGIAIL
jgi:hypothetical protein